jgi:hypothetical protein
MSDVNPKVLALVERELKKNPDTPSTTLQEKAAKVDRSVASLTGRQFHARYGLLARRKLSGSKRPKGASRKKRGGSREMNPVDTLLTEGFRQRITEVEEAFDRAVKAGNMARVNRLLSALNRCAGEGREA